MTSHPGTGFAAWAGSVGDLCGAIDAIEPLAAAVGAPDPRTADWHGALFGKLRPQVSREPLLVAAVCGGTNTGKSLITNTLVGAEISRSVPEAARTRHPVASLPLGLAGRIDLAELFPGFSPAAWTGEEDAIGLGPDAAGNHDRLVWREDAGGRQPQRLVLLDTPDIDGTLRENWHRAELVRNACDVLVAVLTQQKYNDAAVRDFFAAAAAARKAVIVVFNMVDWPRQRDRIAGWLATFTAETGVAPLAVYAVPHDFRAAEAGRIEFHPLAELTPDGRTVDLAARLADCDFDRIKLDAMAGALRVVLEPAAGVGSWLDAFEATARQWQNTRRLCGSSCPRRRGRSSGTRSGSGSSPGVRPSTSPSAAVTARSAGALPGRRGGRAWDVAMRSGTTTSPPSSWRRSSRPSATSSTGSTTPAAATSGSPPCSPTGSSRPTAPRGTATSSGGMRRCRWYRRTTARSCGANSTGSPRPTPAR
jgi:hypothetical protein